MKIGNQVTREGVDSAPRRGCSMSQTSPSINQDATGLCQSCEHYRGERTAEPQCAWAGTIGRVPVWCDTSPVDIEPTDILACDAWAACWAMLGQHGDWLDCIETKGGPV